MANPTFSTVKAILDRALLAFSNPPPSLDDLQAAMGSGFLGWGTYRDLMASTAVSNDGNAYRLLPPGQLNPADAASTPLYLVLSGQGIGGSGPMPPSPAPSPAVGRADLDTILLWIRNGCPDDPRLATPW